MADKNDQSNSNSEAADPDQSIFDLFEPAPERDANSFGKIPVIRDEEIDLTENGRSAEVKAAADAEAAGLQHWTAPPTGQVPAVLTSDKDESGLWADVKGPSWHGDDPSWAGPDLADVFADTGSVNLDASLDEFEDEDEDYDDEESLGSVAVQRPARPIGGAPAPTTSRRRPVPESRPLSETSPTAVPRPAPETRPAPERESVTSVFDDSARSTPPPFVPPPARPRPTSDTGNQSLPQTRPPVAQPAARKVAPPISRQNEPRRAAPAPAVSQTEHPPPVRGDRDVFVEQAVPAREERTLTGALAEAQQERLAPQVPIREQHEPNIDDIEFADEEEYYDEDERYGFAPVGGRNIPQAIAVGLVLAGVVLAAMWFGPYTTLAVVVVLALLAVLELYNAMRMAGLRPATLLGVVGTVAAPAAAFYRGDAAFPLIVALAVVFGTLWYLVGADTERPVLNLSLTMMGIFWVGGLAAFGALMLRDDGGIELLLATIIITVASDTMAYIGGRAYGSRPFHHASPNKTWEGTITGFLGALFAGFAIGVTEMGTIWDTKLVPAIVLGAVVGCLAPMGDLAESVVKRDLGVKDMGTLLPGHGGVLDRLDGLLFALPGAYYLALVYSLI